jgi:hypothetical protein
VYQGKQGTVKEVWLRQSFGSGFKQVSPYPDSESGFVIQIRIRIQEGKNDPQK